MRGALARLIAAAGGAVLLFPLAPGIATALGAPAGPTGSAPVNVDGLRVDDLSNPLGIDDTTPNLSWQLNSTGANKSQSAYEVRAATTMDRLASGPDVWDSGRVTSTRSINVGYAGAPLRSRERVYWQVRVWDEHGQASAWSLVAYWEMGLLDKSDWSADWITHRGWLPPEPKPVIVSLPTQTARYVRLDVTKLGFPIAEGSGPVYRLQLAEIGVRDGSGSPIDLALQAPVITNDSETIPGSWEPRFLTDGVLLSDGTPYGYTSQAYPSPTIDHDIWVQLDLGSQQQFDQILLYPRTDTTSPDGHTPCFPVDYTVETGDDPAGPFHVATTVSGQEPPQPEGHPAALPIFAKQFTLDKPIARARLYATGLGVYVATINGERVSPAVLEPPNTDYTKRVIYSTYDVTSLLQHGPNAVGVRLGNGIYNVPSTLGRYDKFVGSMGLPKMLAQLEVTYTDGTTQTIASDRTWRSTLGATTFSNWYGGEDVDARRVQQNWDQPGADTSSWTRAAVTTPPGSNTLLSARATPAIEQVDTVAPVDITQPKPDTYVFDLGANFAGWEQLRVSGPAGTKVTMHPGEELNQDGTVNQASMGAPVWDTYILRGQGTETWHPDFTYHGFRYLQVTGLPAAPTKNTITGIVLRAANERAGSFDSSNTLINDIHQIIDQAITSNMLNPGTSDPNRERLGWLEETHLVFGAISHSYDVAAYYRALVQNMAEAQTPNGLIPDIAPEYTVFSGGFRDDPNWGDAIILDPWHLYRAYGDTETLRSYYGNMQRYLDYLTDKANEHLLAYGLGDWAETGATTPVGVTATYGYFRSAQVLSKIAAVLGKSSDAHRYASLAEQIGEAFNNTYYDAAHGTYANGTQADDAIALDMGIVPDADRSAVLNHLTSDIRAHDEHLTVGEIALPSLLRVLSAAGRDDLLYEVATQTTYPSWGNDVVSGATALPEFPGNVGELNMYMRGAIDAWLSTDLAGLQQSASATAYGHLVIRPAVVGDLAHADSSYQTPYGMASSRWRRVGKTFHLDVRVPVNATATVHMPVWGGPASASGGARPVSTGPNWSVYQVGSGDWSFVSHTDGTVPKNEQQLDVQAETGSVALLPGVPSKASFRVFNLMDQQITVRPQLTVPDGYTASLDQDNVTIAAHSAVQVTVTVIRQSGTAGKGSLSFTAGDDSTTVPLTPTDDWARIAEMTASSTAAGFSASAAADGITDSTGWGSGPGDGGWNDNTAGVFPDTLTAAWNEPVTLGRVVVYTLDSATYPAGIYGIRDVDIQAHVDGQWQTVAQIRGNTAGVLERSFAPVKADALRLVVRDSNDHAYSRVVEFQAYES